MQDRQSEKPTAPLENRASHEAFTRHDKKLWLVYVLAVPLGWLGVHRLYLRRRVTGLLMLVFSLIALLIAGTVMVVKPDLLRAMLCDALAGLLLLVTLVWELVDLFLIPFMVRRCNLQSNLKQKPQAGQAV